MPDCNALCRRKPLASCRQLLGEAAGPDRQHPHPNRQDRARQRIHHQPNSQRQKHSSETERISPEPARTVRHQSFRVQMFVFDYPRAQIRGAPRPPYRTEKDERRQQMKPLRSAIPGFTGVKREITSHPTIERPPPVNLSGKGAHEEKQKEPPAISKEKIPALRTHGTASPPDSLARVYGWQLRQQTSFSR